MRLVLKKSFHRSIPQQGERRLRLYRLPKMIAEMAGLDPADQRDPEEKSRIIRERAQPSPAEHVCEDRPQAM
jgi:hypothetical protein